MSPRAGFSHLVIRASAGTGKTFRLAHRYLGLIAAGERADHILAVTFARKAAGEILDRVLVRLAEAVERDEVRQDLAKHLQLAGLRKKDCQQWLRTLVGRLHRLRVGTLDSLFVQLAGHFSFELGLPPLWRITDEQEATTLRDRAIDALLANESASDAVELMHMLNKGEAQRKISEQLRKLVDELYELFRHSDAQAWTRLARRTQLEPGELHAAIDRLVQLDFRDNKNWSKSHLSDISAVNARDWDTFISKGLASKIVAGELSYYRKPIEPHIVEVYEPLIAEAKASIINRLVRQNEATYGLLKRYDREIRRLKHEHRALRFDDVTYTLSQALSQQRLPATAFRFDAQIEHLLLDEFQDTSRQQWHILRPIAQQITASDRHESFFCVGDVKQAIYGWRGGEAEIFEALSAELTGITVEPLDKSYRSSPVVMDAVNQIFASLPGNPATSDFGQVVQRWQGRFQPHSTDRTDYPGHVRLLVAPLAQEGEKQSRVTLECAAAEIARLAEDNPGRSMGVLVRKNKTVAQIMYLLRSRHNLAASEEGGNPLTDSLAVSVVLALLKLADHPGDTIARFHVGHTPLGAAVGLTDDTDNAVALRVSRSIRAQLLEQGYGSTIYGWLPALATWCDDRELGRARQLVELAYRYDADATLRCDDFAALVNSQKVEDPRAAPIRVMTVHQSKGLQFDIVVLPELDGRLKGQPPRVVVGRSAVDGSVERVCRYVGQEEQSLLPSEFQELFDQWPQQFVNESLCVLYVALTRAIHALHLIVAATKPDKHGTIKIPPPATFAGLVRGGLAVGQTAVGGAVLYEAGQSDWHAHAKAAPMVDALASVKSQTLDVRLATQRQSRGWERQTPSGLAGGPTVSLSQRLRRESTHGERFGSLIHALFEHVGWLDDGLPDESLLNAALSKLQVNERERGEALERFRDMLQQPTVRKTLSRAEYDPAEAQIGAPDVTRSLRNEPVRLEVQRERPFVVRRESALLHGTIDRLVLLYQGEQLMAADVIDFKTDRLTDSAAVDAALAIYRPQLEAYRYAVAQWTHLPIARISARLLFLGRDEVRSI